MANKYIFNTKTLTYEKLHSRFRDKALKVLSYTLTSLFFSFIRFTDYPRSEGNLPVKAAAAVLC